MKVMASTTTPMTERVLRLLQATYSVYSVLGLVLAVSAGLMAQRAWGRSRTARAAGCRSAVLYPHRDPVFGLDYVVRIWRALNAAQALETWHADLVRLGSGYTHLVLPFGRQMLISADPALVRAVLAGGPESAWEVTGPRRDIFVAIIGLQSLLTVNGPAWRHARALVRPAFHRDQIADQRCLERHVGRLLARIPRDGSTVDMQELLFLMTIDMATEFLFGISTDMLVKPTAEGREFATSLDFTVNYAATHGRFGAIGLMVTSAKFRKAVAACHRCVDRLITQRMQLLQAASTGDDKKSTNPADDGQRYVFLDALTTAGVSPSYVREQMLSILIAGRETTAAALSVLLWILARRPDVVARLRQELLASSIDLSQPTLEQLHDLRYLGFVIKEVLRLYPIVPVSSRGASRDTVLPRGGGQDGSAPLFIPKGSVFTWSVYTMHRRKDLFGDDADDFRPDRWEDLRPASWAYLPFGGGPRVCIGQQFAFTQITYLVARLFQTFVGLEARDDLPLLQRLGATTSLVNGCFIGFDSGLGLDRGIDD